MAKLYTIKEHYSVAPDVWRMVLEGDIGACAGQFIQVRVSPSFDPLLRRPLSIHDCRDGEFTILYRIMGRGTTLMSGKKCGECLDVLGPLGNGFPMSDSKEVVLVAGGIGVAPLFYLARVLRGRGQKIKLLFGAKTKEELYVLDELKSLVPDLFIATDDGSAGYCGPVTELLAPLLTDVPATIYACGPEPMLRQVALLAGRSNRESYLSLEARMACGVGACLGCVVTVQRDGERTYSCVCTQGPVFRGEEVFQD